MTPAYQMVERRWVRDSSAVRVSHMSAAEQAKRNRAVPGSCNWIVLLLRRGSGDVWHSGHQKCSEPPATHAAVRLKP